MILQSSLPLEYTRSKKIFQGLNTPLRLTISLGMVSWTEFKLGSQSLLQLLPEVRQEPCISIIKNILRHSMQPNDLIDCSQITRLKGILIGKKWVDLVSWSTMTHMASFPKVDRNNRTMKSMTIISHFHSGTTKGSRNLVGLVCSTLTCYHTKHLLTMQTMSLFMPFHQKSRWTSRYIFVHPGWITNLSWWSSCNIWRLGISFWGTQRWFRK